MKKFSLSLLILLLSVTVWTIGAEKKMMPKSLGVSEFTSESRTQPMSQRELIYVTEYITALLQQNEDVLVKNRFEVGKIVYDPTLTQKEVIRDAGERIGADAMLMGTVKKDKSGEYTLKLTIIGVKTKNDAEVNALFSENSDVKENLKTQLEQLPELVYEDFGNVVNGRSIFGPPDFRKIGLGLQVGFQNGVYTEVGDPSMVMGPVSTDYSTMTGSINFNLSSRVFMLLSGMMVTATDNEFYPLGNYVALPTQGTAFHTYEIKSLIEDFNGLASGSLYRSSTNSYMVGGGLGFRFWKFRLSGQYLVSISSDVAFAPASAILAGADFYLINTFFVGINYVILDETKSISLPSVSDMRKLKFTPDFKIGDKGGLDKFGVNSSTSSSMMQLKVGFEF